MYVCMYTYIQVYTRAGSLKESRGEQLVSEDEAARKEEGPATAGGDEYARALHAPDIRAPQLPRETTTR